MAVAPAAAAAGPAELATGVRSFELAAGGGGALLVRYANRSLAVARPAAATVAALAAAELVTPAGLDGGWTVAIQPVAEWCACLSFYRGRAGLRS